MRNQSAARSAGSARSLLRTLPSAFRNFDPSARRTPRRTYRLLRELPVARLQRAESALSAPGVSGQRWDAALVGLDEPLRLETALRTLRADTRLALLHYAPIRETLEGASPEIFPFLGTSRLLPPIETYAPDVVFHGRAHIGAPAARTPSGIPVHNVRRRYWSARPGTRSRSDPRGWPDRRPAR
jgi:hypothetical protein